MQNISRDKNSCAQRFWVLHFLKLFFFFLLAIGYLRKPVFARQKQVIYLHSRSARRNTWANASTSNFRVSAGLSRDPV